MAAKKTKRLPHDSDSTAQRDGEVAALEWLRSARGFDLKPATFELGDGSKVTVDGFAEGPPAILAEVCARLGGMNEGTRKKVLADALKLLALKKLLHADARLLLVLACEETAAEFHRNWRRAALEALGVELVVTTLPEDVAASVRAAQAKQRLSNMAKPAR